MLGAYSNHCLGYILAGWSGWRLFDANHLGHLPGGKRPLRLELGIG